MACFTPFHKKDEIRGEWLSFPCGRCPECVKRAVSGWSFRLMKEAEVSTSALFVTLTYNTENVHITENGFMTLNKRDPQLFMKRLRKRHHKRKKEADYWKPIKYYLVGEYGGKFKRPHFHIILFNSCQEDVLDAWRLGHVHFGKVTPASVAYSLVYISKKNQIPEHNNDDRLKEFAHMSKGLGLSYLTKSMVKWHKSDLTERFYVPLQDGKKIAMPRYYKDKIYTEEEKEKIGEVLKERLEFDSFDERYGDDAYNMRAEYHAGEFEKMKVKGRRASRS